MSALGYSGRTRLCALALGTVAVLCFTVAASAQPASVNLSGLKSDASNDRFIVKYRGGSAQRNDSAIIQKSLDDIGRRRVQGGKALGLRRARRMAVGADVVIADRKLDKVEAEDLMRQIASDPSVEYVEVDAILRPDVTPNDPSYPQQWGYSGAWGIRADKAWDITSGAGVVVAVIDTGITSHSDLNANVLPGYDFISDAATARDGDGRDSNPRDEGDWCPAQYRDSSWHGTHVAGTVAAVTNNAAGVAGVAYRAKILPVRVMGACGGYMSDTADAIVWASGGTVANVPVNPNPAEVINMSLGGRGTCLTTLQNAINGAVARGTTVVASAGNDNVDAAGQMPANCSNVIVVAATDSQGNRSSFSNFGSIVDIAAPGSNILSTLNSGLTTPGGETYASYNGTSMAAPHVAGVIALMQSAADTPKTPAEIEQILKTNASPFTIVPTQPIGAGLANAFDAVNAVRVTPLVNGVPLTGLSGAAGSQRMFAMDIPVYARVTIQASGGTGDANIYVNYGSPPTLAKASIKAEGPGNEILAVLDRQAGKVYVLLHGSSAYAGLTLTASYKPFAVKQVQFTPPTDAVEVANGARLTNLSDSIGGVRLYALQLPPDKTVRVTAAMNGGSGDADLYINYGSPPTPSMWTVRGYDLGNNVESYLDRKGGTFYYLIHAYEAYSGVSLELSYREL
jgi:serine protease